MIIFDSYQECREHLDSIIKGVAPAIGIPMKNVFYDVYPTVTPALLVYDHLNKNRTVRLGNAYNRLDLFILITDSFKKGTDAKVTALNRIKSIIQAIEASNKYNEEIFFEEMVTLDKFEEQTVDKFNVLISFHALYKL